MRRYFALLAVLVGGGAALVAAAPATARNAAVHIKNSGCGLIDGNGGFAFTTATKGVITHSGNANFVCKAKVAPSSAGRSVRFNFANTGFLCGTPDGNLTIKWGETVSASGNATLRCHASS
jgi:hypothetical protein